MGHKKTVKNAVRIIAILSVLLMMAGCFDTVGEGRAPEKVPTEAATVPEAPAVSEALVVAEEAGELESELPDFFHIDDIPPYTGTAYAVVNQNVPYFTDRELSATSYEYYSDLDSLGRCGVCVASVGPDIMPTEKYGVIGSIKPTGWQTVKYPGIIDGNYLYNRCHLIGFQLTGENANEKNLITGTRYMNVEGMLPFENLVVDFVKATGYHVMYRVTPIFDGDNLVASGVLMEAKSVEDQGGGILFNVFCYNVQPGITIDYATGNNAEAGIAAAEEAAVTEQTQEATQESQDPADTSADRGVYAVNGRNGKIHITGKCPATGNDGNAMKYPAYYDTYEEAEAASTRIARTLDKRKCGNCWK